MVAMVNAIPAFAIGRKYVFNGRRPKLALIERHMSPHGRTRANGLHRTFKFTHGSFIKALKAGREPNISSKQAKS
jgi:hypothetical protein